jgi:hypothetical protein
MTSLDFSDTGIRNISKRFDISPDALIELIEQLKKGR